LTTRNPKESSLLGHYGLYKYGRTDEAYPRYEHQHAQKERKLEYVPSVGRQDGERISYSKQEYHTERHHVEQLNRGGAEAHQWDGRCNFCRYFCPSRLRYAHYQIQELINDPHDENHKPPDRGVHHYGEPGKGGGNNRSLVAQLNGPGGELGAEQPYPIRIPPQIYRVNENMYGLAALIFVSAIKAQSVGNVTGRSRIALC